MSSNQSLVTQQPGALADPGGPGSEDIVTYAKWVVESGLFGRGITQAQAGLKMLVGRELGIQPLAAVRNIYIFEAQGRPVVILDATLMGAMVRTSGRYDYEVVRHDDEGTVLAMYRVEGSTRTLLGEASFTRENAAKTPLLKKEGPWTQGYAREMYFARAMSRLVDHYAPELLLGLSVPVVTQEDADEMPMGHDQRKAIFAGLKPFGMDDDERHRWASDVLGRDVPTFSDGNPGCPTRAEAQVLLRWLEDNEAEATPPEDIVEGELFQPDVEPRGEDGDAVGADWAEPVPEESPGAGDPKPGEVKPSAPAAPPPEPPSTLDVLMTEYEAVKATRKPQMVGAWLASWTENEKLPGMEFADEEQAERGLSWLRAMFGGRR